MSANPGLQNNLLQAMISAGGHFTMVLVGVYWVWGEGEWGLYPLTVSIHRDPNLKRTNSVWFQTFISLSVKLYSTLVHFIHNNEYWVPPHPNMKHPFISLSFIHRVIIDSWMKMIGLCLMCPWSKSPHNVISSLNCRHRKYRGQWLWLKTLLVTLDFSLWFQFRSLTPVKTHINFVLY